ncbi:hypothetical protein EIN_281650 [Entamoeba invadens IP1]|uniref:Uncharacterized protein n=1 Tax=Entamoeba invadens IP1 TaxID=370355 RepID=A0A0A1U2M5_ENTIV|nr:hypothetical protein EIN_281650 [Entamoeba invadens IP1]ELP85794.1 hypothetical protein EIN_281650 [Entamoeba invadens IP1]|eukprot:XP_004185140.1 hypothetical protein EIN_281650 [Entamoeba invadens IP1]
MSSHDGETLSSCPSPKNLSENTPTDQTDQISEDNSDTSDNLVESEEEEHNESCPLQKEAVNPPKGGFDYKTQYGEKVEECVELHNTVAVMKAKIEDMETKIADQQEIIEKMIIINEQIMHDKEVVLSALQKVNDERVNIENELNEMKKNLNSAIDVNLSYTTPSKDVKVVNISFDKYLFVKYNTSRPFGVICLFNEQKQCKVISNFTEKKSEISLEEYYYYEPNGRGNALKVKEGEQIVSLTTDRNDIITVGTLPPLYDRFHKVSLSNSFLIGKKEYYITVVDLGTVDKSKPVLETKAFGVILETELKEKKPGMVDLFDDYLDLFRQINRGVLILYVASTNVPVDVFRTNTRETVTKPTKAPPGGIMYIESKILKIEKYNIPFLFPVPYREDRNYSVTFFTSPFEDKFHIIDVV